MNASNLLIHKSAYIDKLSYQFAIFIFIISLVSQVWAPTVLSSCLAFAFIGSFNFFMMGMSYQYLPDPYQSKKWLYTSLIFFNLYTFDPLFHVLGLTPFLFLTPVCLTFGHLLFFIHVIQEARNVQRTLGYSGFILDVNMIFISCMIIPFLAFSKELVELLQLHATGILIFLAALLINAWWLTACILAYFIIYLSQIPKLCIIGISTFSSLHYIVSYAMYANNQSKYYLLLHKLAFAFYGFASSFMLIYARQDNSKTTVKELKLHQRTLKFVLFLGIGLIVAAIPIGVLIAVSRGTKVPFYFLLLATILSVSTLSLRMIVTINQYVNQHKRTMDESLHDPMTGLYNLTGLFESFDLRQKPSIVGVFSINNFKTINNLHGHILGDKILCQFALELTRVADTFSHENKAEYALARIEGNEFVMVIWNYYSTDYFSQYFSQHIEQWWTLDDFSIFINYSFGVSPFSNANFTTRVTEANYALQEARQTHCKVLPPHKLDWNQPSLIIKNSKLIQEAIRDKSVIVHFQPIFSAKTGKLESFEALARLSIQNKLVLPQDFLEVVDNDGLSKTLASTIFEIIALNKHLLPPVPISINISPHLLLSSDVVSWLADSFATLSLHCNDFVLEILENEDIDDDTLRQRVYKLIDLGFQIAIDDYGTGFSNLARLAELPIHYLKIDRSLLLAAVKGNTSLFELAVNMAHKQGYITIIEGIENKEQLALAKRLKVDCVQGWLMGKPAEARDIQKQFKNNPAMFMFPALLKTPI